MADKVISQQFVVLMADKTSVSIDLEICIHEID